MDNPKPKPSKPTETDLERLRTMTVELLLDLYRQALQAGWNPLDLWDQISNRLRAAARTTTSPEEWASQMLRSLKIAAPNKYSSASLADLAAHVRERGWARVWLDLLGREHGYLVALARKLNEERKAERLAAAAAVVDPVPSTP